ncbi:MAG: hypothetical protein ACRDFA_12475, partial [bacterium]
MIGALVPPATAQSVPGWRLYETPQFHIYAVDGSRAAGDIEQIKADLELMHMEVIAPLDLPPSRLIYPLYPSLDVFRRDWWHFATLGYGEVVHAWGTIYTGDSRAITPYTLTRAVVSDVFPRAIPLLRWGLGEALGDSFAGVDANGHLKAALDAGLASPALRDILAPSDFGDALPMSYPTAVSFMAFLIERYGFARTAAFAERVDFRYFDFAELFILHFGTRLADVEQAWQARISSATVLSRIDSSTYLAANSFVYRITLAGNPGRQMLLPDGPVVVSEAFAAVEPLRRLNLERVRTRMQTAARASRRAEQQERRTETTLRGIVYVVVLTPILFAVGWLLWPSIRARAGVP